MVSLALRDEASVTAFPLTGLLFASSSVTVIVALATPSAGTVVGLAETVEVVADTDPATNVNAAVCVRTRLSLLSVAVIVLVPAVVERTVPVV
jgi:RES domain-containing protein